MGGRQNPTPYFIMTIKQQAKKELNRIKRSMKYREKKYGIRFEGLDRIENRILKREVKRFTKRDLEYLKQIRGEELERYGEAEGGIKGYDITKYIRNIRTTRTTRKDSKTPRSFNIQPLPDEEAKRIRKEKLDSLDYKYDEKDTKLVSSAEQIINNFLDRATWRGINENDFNKIVEFIEDAIRKYGGNHVANALEDASANGDIIDIKNNGYRRGIKSSLSTLNTYLMGSEEEERALYYLDDLINDTLEEEYALYDYESMFGYDT